jgi:cysteinyl-tRNA synthetase
MSMKYLGETFDLHTGGEDHLFPHHECEIAQSEAATGKPFVNHWVHVRFLRVDSERMAKSKGGFLTLDDVVGWGFDPLAFRLLALGAGYRNGLDFTQDGMGAAQSRLDRWRRTVRAAYAATEGRVAEPEGEHEITREFRAALADDLNTPKALATAEKALALAAVVDVDEQERALWILFDMDRVLGLSLQSGAAAKDELSAEERAVFDEREAARKSGDYAKSDELRKELLDRFGIQVKDTKDGTRWERVWRKGA